MEIKSNNEHLIIADASGLVSVTIATDDNHQRAVTAAAEWTDRYILVMIPSETFAEAINILGKKFGHAKAFQAGQALLDSRHFLVVDTDELIRLDALKRFQTASAGVSFTDCLVMATADKYETRHIFGFDEIFSKKGYQLPTRLKKAA